MTNSQDLQKKAKAELARRELARRHLKDFAAYTYDGYMANWHTELICDALERVEKGEIRFLFIEAPPRHSKSLHVSQLFPAWVVGRDKDADIIVSSYSGDLATTHGRETRNLMGEKRYKNVFKTRLATDSTAKGKWNTDGKGAYNAVGVGGSTTGKGAKFFIVDDSLKDRKEAESEVIREGIWDWFRSVARTRLTPDGAMVVMQCMVGDTNVLLPDKSTKKLKDIKIGDKVSTYRDGKICMSEVTDWSNQGSDYIYTITTKSGKIVRANERHPFLIKVKGKAQWVKLKDLKVGNLMHVVHGQELNVKKESAINLQNVKGGVTLATESIDGLKVTDQHQSIQEATETRTLNTDTESQLKTTKRCKRNNQTVVQSVYSLLVKMSERTGVENFVLTTVMILAKFVAYCVTTATWLWGTVKQKMFCLKPQNTSDFILDEIVCIEQDGYEDVFDLTIKDTENFIANGVVSHNTRWHMDDLIGRLQNTDTWIDYFDFLTKGLDGNKWVRLRLPAFADKDEIYRKKGEPLWPERYSHDELEDIKSSLGPYEFSALYQQTPVAAGNQEFNPEWYKYITNSEMDSKWFPKRYLTIDTAVSQKESADFTGFVDNRVDDKNVWHLEAWKQRITPDKLIDQLFSLQAQNNYTTIGIEETMFLLVIKPFLDAEMRKRDIYLPIVPLKHEQTKKEIRVRALIPRYASGSIYHIEGKCSELEFEQSVFPFGANDDVIDSCAYQVQLVGKAGKTGFKQHKPTWNGTNKTLRAATPMTKRY